MHLFEDQIIWQFQKVFVFKNMHHTSELFNILKTRSGTLYRVLSGLYGMWSSMKIPLLDLGMGIINIVFQYLLNLLKYVNISGWVSLYLFLIIYFSFTCIIVCMYWIQSNSFSVVNNISTYRCILCAIRRKAFKHWKIEWSY